MRMAIARIVRRLAMMRIAVAIAVMVAAAIGDCLMGACHTGAGG